MIKNLLAIGLFSTSSLGFAQTQVYVEDFENGIPGSYTIVDNDGLTPNTATVDFADAWISLPDPLDSLDTIVGSTSYFEPTGTADRWLITPQITLGAFGNSVSWDSRSHDASYPDGYYVLVSSTDTQLASFTDTIFFVSAANPTWSVNTANLSDHGLDGQQVHIAFVNRTYDGFKLYLDSISVTVEDPVGINELNTPQILMSPNPATETVYFNGSMEEIRLYNMSGELVSRFKNTTKINIVDLVPGMYHIEIKNKGIIFREKLLKN